MMTKKDYIKFADMIAERKSMLHRTFTHDADENAQFIMDFVQMDMIRVFEADNPNFDEVRFNQYIDKRVEQLSHH